MQTNTIVYDQVYRMLVTTRAVLRELYDRSLSGNETEEVYFYLDSDNKTVIQGDETDDDAARCVLSHDNRNSDLRVLARDVMYALIAP